MNNISAIVSSGNWNFTVFKENHPQQSEYVRPGQIHKANIGNDRNDQNKLYLSLYQTTFFKKSLQ